MKLPDRVLPRSINHLIFSFTEKKPFISENNVSTENVESDNDFYFQYKPEEMLHLEYDLESHKSTSNDTVSQNLQKSTAQGSRTFSLKG